MKINATALDSFAHGRTQYQAGDPVELSPGEADEMRKAGLVDYEDATQTAPQTGVTDSQDVDDLLEGEKAEDAPANKMAPAPKNKGK